MSNVVCGTVIPIFGQPYDTSQSNPQVSPGKFGKKNKLSPIYTLYLFYLNRLYGIQNKAVAPCKSKELISVYSGL